MHHGLMQVFNYLYIVRRHNGANITQALHPSALAAGKANRESAIFARCFQRQQYIGRIAAGADGKRDIARLQKIFKLLGKYSLIAKIIGPGADERHVVSERHGFRPSIRTRIAHALIQVTHHVRRVGSAAAIAKNEDGPLFFHCLKKHGDNLADRAKRKLRNQRTQVLKILCNG